jgi:hypothetical protein
MEVFVSEVVRFSVLTFSLIQISAEINHRPEQANICRFFQAPEKLARQASSKWQILTHHPKKSGKVVAYLLTGFGRGTLLPCE